MKENIYSTATHITVKIQIGYFFRQAAFGSACIDKEKMSVASGSFQCELYTVRHNAGTFCDECAVYIKK